MPIRTITTEPFPEKEMARSGNYKALLKKMNGAPREGLYVGKIGFLTELYMEKPPTLIKEIEAYDMGFSFSGGSSNIYPQAFKIAEKLAPRSHPHTLLSTADKQVMIHVIVLNAGETSRHGETNRVLNMDADAVWYVHQGNGVCATSLGWIEFRTGDFIYIPARVCHKFVATNDTVGGKVIMVGMESAGGFEAPERRVIDNIDIPYSSGDVRLPNPDYLSEFDNPDNSPSGGMDKSYAVFVKRDNEWNRIVYPETPFQCVAWRGYVYPFAIHASDLHFAYTTAIHPDPSNFALFAAKDMSAVLSVLGPRYVHSLPYNHLNQWEEALFYARDYEAREGSAIGAGDMTLHPQGVWHGPQIHALHNWKTPERAEWRDELAIMFEAAKPLLLCEDGERIRVPGYERSWYESWEEYQESQKEK